ncbi:MAG: hypothetical protein COW42_04800 [Deltaproteobacteria bacterium CG17_big_fil_post_rev_8_21_14_2_50_63_7]|nr:MAG: hypothetical protein COW42_04800 [Deltaproteobacteria bacterium CG17_big_fil_post_rev_8_21_14_2_50_63_7]
MVCSKEQRKKAMMTTQRASLTLFLVILGAAVLVGCGPSTQTPPRTSSALLEDPVALDARIREDLTAIRPQVDEYFQRYGELPERLPALRDTPDGVALMESLPRDPWNVPYLLRRIDQDVVIYSTGPDLIVGSEDDIRMRLSFADVVREEPPVDEPVPVASEPKD